MLDYVLEKQTAVMKDEKTVALSELYLERVTDYLLAILWAGRRANNSVDNLET
jgi:dsDNA-binding SOS-regulon protein